MRESDWSIVWEPEGETPLVLLSLGSLMDSEIRLNREQLTSAGKSDFALRLVMLSRKNAKRRLEFTRRDSHVSNAASWKACLSALKAAPWGLKGTLRIIPRGGAARDYTAALLSTAHRPASEDGFVESVHNFAFRVIPIS